MFDFRELFRFKLRTPRIWEIALAITSMIIVGNVLEKKFFGENNGKIR